MLEFPSNCILMPLTAIYRSVSDLTRLYIIIICIHSKCFKTFGILFTRGLWLRKT